MAGDWVAVEGGISDRGADRPLRGDGGRSFIANCEQEQARRRLLARRMREALEGVSYASIADRTGWSAESVRRYVLGQAAPPATLLMVLAERLSINPGFLLLGRGPVRFERGTVSPEAVSPRQIMDTLHFLLAQHLPDGGIPLGAAEDSGADAEEFRLPQGLRGSPNG